MYRQQVVIIGSGLGGLSCGVILAKNGYKVTVLEQGIQTGGCLQCFQRRGAKFETGMHFIGSADEGQPLDRLMKYLEIRKDITLSPLDKNGYDVIRLNGKEYRFANGRDAFIDQLAMAFPHERKALEEYFDTIERVASASALHSLQFSKTDTALNTEYQMRTVNEVIDSIISDPLLRKVLVGNLPLYAGEKDKTPFSTHAFITDFYNQGAYRIVGGSESIATSLVSTIESYGGCVLKKQKVKKIVTDDEKALGVETSEGQFFPAEVIISDTHPMRTLEMIDSKQIRPAFRERINAMPQTVGGFSVYLEFQEDSMPYMNYNYYGYEGDSPWNCEHYDWLSWPKGFLYMHFCHEPSPRYAKTGVILSYMQMKDVAPFRCSEPFKRKDGYKEFKQEKAEKLIDCVEKQLPGLRSHIKHYYTSTPLTYLDYTGTEGGSMYGIAKDVNSGIANRVPHKTRIPNVLQTGQNINSHGMLGVIVGSIVTCSELLTAEHIYRQITNSK